MSKLIVSRFNVESQSSNKTYVVSQYDDGSWACSCPKWIFSKGHKENCKHINETIEKQNFAKINYPTESTLTITGLTESQADKVMTEVLKLNEVKKNGDI